MLAAVGTFALLGAPAAAAWHVATRHTRDWRAGLGYAGLAWAAWAVLVAELLSIGDGRLTREWLFVAWLLPACYGATLLWQSKRPLWRGLRGAAREVRSWGRWERVLLAGLGVCLSLTLLVALVAAPNNWDSHVYHLARVAQWAQLGDVTHYATNVDPQNYQPPGAELLIAHGFVLAGGDALANLVQWFAYAGSIALAAAAAAALGGGRLVQLAAATLVATTPLAILEASSTQNDLLLGFWLLLAATLAARIWTKGDEGGTLLLVLPALGASAALGMAALTKGTGLLFALPVGVLLAAAVLRRTSAARAGVLALAGLVLVALPNAGQWARNHDTYGSIIATSHAGIENPYRVEDPDLGTLVGNLVRNATNHLDMPVAALNDAIERGTVRMLDAVGIDAHDPRSTFLDQGFRVGPFGPHEDHAGSIVLLVLGLWAAVVTVAAARRRRRERWGVQLAWLGMLAAQVLLFCWLITWQNWHVRMHLPVLLGVAVLVAVQLARFRRALIATLVVVLALAPLYLLFNVTRPLIGSDSILTSSRTATMFEPRPQLQAPYGEAIERLSDAGIEQAGLVTGIDDWQYAAIALGADAEPPVRFRELLVSGPSAALGDTSVGDTAGVLCVRCQPHQQAALQAAGLEQVPLEHGGERQGRGDDVTSVELWLRDAALTLVD